MLKSKKMINLRRLAVYILAFLLLLTVSAVISAKGLLIPFDQLVYRTFYANPEVDEKFDQKIMLIDLPHQSKNEERGYLTVEEFRNQLAFFLNTVDSMVPEHAVKKPTVILDISFSNAEGGIPALKQALAGLQQKHIRVYGSYPTPDASERISFSDHDGKQAKALYDDFEGGRKHTDYNTYDDDCLLTFDSFRTIGSDKIESLAVRVANDYFGVERTDFKTPVTYTLPLQDIKKFRDHTYEFTEDTLAMGNGIYPKWNKSLDLSDKFIIVGVFGVDQKQICNDSYPGPFLLARAITDRLQNNALSKEAHSDVAIQLVMIFLFAFLVCLFFAVIHKYVKSMQTKPLLIATLAFAIGVILLIAFGYAILKYAVIRPALPMLSMFWASVLAWRFTKKFLVTGIMEGGQVYDVFISYSFGDSYWVRQNLFNPLKALKKQDGSDLNIFFAEKSIGIGELFTTKYMRAIVDSKLFVPVMSREYYNKNHCKNEMDLAVKRKIEKLIDICILAFDYKFVPEEFTNILLLDVKQKTDFIDTLQHQLIKVEQSQPDERDPDYGKTIEATEDQLATVDSAGESDGVSDTEAPKEKGKGKKKKDKLSKKKDKRKGKKEDKKKTKKAEKAEKEKSKKKSKKDGRKKSKKKALKVGKKKDKKQAKKEKAKAKKKPSKKSDGKKEKKRDKKRSKKNGKTQGKKKKKKS